MNFPRELQVSLHAFPLFGNAVGKPFRDAPCCPEGREGPWRHTVEGTLVAPRAGSVGAAFCAVRELQPVQELR
eukprot:12791548-Alexandrium_andersonii.AAC.1